MSWRDRLRPASFRGVPFEVDGNEHGFGRRFEIHTYPLRDKPFAEDLGRAPRQFRIEGYVLGADYDSSRDALIAALETEGPGELVHPSYGRRQVACVTSACREDKTEGGLAVFSLEFVEAGENTAPAITVATTDAATSAAAGMSSQAAQQLVTGFSTAASPGFVVDQAAALTEHLNLAAEAAAVLVAPAGATLDSFRRQVASIRASVLDLVAAPAALAAAATGLINQVRLLATTPAAALQALRPFTEFGSTLAAVLGDTPARGRQRANQAAYLALVRRAAAAECVAVVTEIEFESYDAAVAVREDIAARIDDLALEAADAGEDEAFAALTVLRQALIRDVTARGASRARLFQYTPSASEPALVIAHRLYGDAGRDEELVARNRIAHPGFVPAARALEALTPDADAG